MLDIPRITPTKVVIAVIVPTMASTGRFQHHSEFKVTINVQIAGDTTKHNHFKVSNNLLLILMFSSPFLVYYLAMPKVFVFLHQESHSDLMNDKPDIGFPNLQVLLLSAIPDHNICDKVPTVWYASVPVAKPLIFLFFAPV